MMRLLAFLRRLADDRRGVAALEFALWSTCFFLTALGGLDFALWRTYQLRLHVAVEQGAMMAFNARDAAGAATATSIRAYVQAAARLPGAVQVNVTCNGGADLACAAKGDTARTCACISTANGVTSYAPASCGSPCAHSAPAGYYLTIRASYPYRPVVLPRNAVFGGTMADSATIPLQ